MVLACRDASHRTPVSEFPRGIAAHVEGWSLGGGRGEIIKQYVRRAHGDACMPFQWSRNRGQFRRE